MFNEWVFVIMHLGKYGYKSLNETWHKWQLIRAAYHVNIFIKLTIQVVYNVTISQQNELYIMYNQMVKKTWECVRDLTFFLLLIPGGGELASCVKLHTLFFLSVNVDAEAHGAVGQ